MKNALACLAASMIVLIASSTSAEMIIYKAAVEVHQTEENRKSNLEFKGFVVIDHDTGNFTEVLHIKQNGQKIFHTAQETNLHFVEVNAPGPNSITVISRVPTQCDIDQGVSGEQVFASGRTSVITISSNATISFPRVLTARHQRVQLDGASGPRLVNTSATLNFDEKKTVASNTAGQTMEEAVALLVSHLEDLGFSENSNPTSDSVTGVVDYMLIFPGGLTPIGGPLPPPPQP